MDKFLVDLLNPFNKLTATITENNIKKWETKGASLRYKQEIEKTNAEMELIKQQNKKMDKEITELRLQGETLDKVYNILTESLKIAQDSLLIIYEHQECSKFILKRQKEQGEKILKEYNQHFEERKASLAKTNPMFIILTEKKIDLQKKQFSIKMLHYKIKEHKWKKNYFLEIRQKLFYAAYIDLAEAWLKRRNYEKRVKKLEETANEEKSLLKELFELNAKIKEKQKVNRIKKSIQNKEATDNALGKLMFAIPELPKNDSLQKPIPKYFPDFRNHQLYHQTSHESSKIIQINNNQRSSAKIHILENKIVKTPNKNSILLEIETNKEEKSKVLKARLEKVVNDFKAKRLSQKKSSNLNCSIVEEKGNTEVQNQINEKKSVTTSISVNKEPESDATQPMGDLQILSQDTNNVLNILSQESGKNVLTKLGEFIHDRENEKDTIKFESQNGKFANNSQNKNNVTSQELKSNVEKQFEKTMDLPVTSVNQLNNPVETKSLKGISNFSLNNNMPNKEHISNNKLIGNSSSPMAAALKENNLVVQNEKSIPKENICNNNKNQLLNKNDPKSGSPKFMMNIPFNLGSDVNTFEPQHNLYRFESNDTVKRQKLDIPQQKNNSEIPLKNIQNIEKAKEANNVDYNFGNVSHFLDSTNLGDYNTSYVMSPEPAPMTGKTDNLNSGISFTGNNFTFGQPGGAFSFSFN